MFASSSRGRPSGDPCAPLRSSRPGPTWARVPPFREHGVSETRAVRGDADAAGAEPGREPHWGPAGPTRAGQGDLIDVWAAVAGRDVEQPECAGRPRRTDVERLLVRYAYRCAGFRRHDPDAAGGDVPEGRRGDEADVAHDVGNAATVRRPSWRVELLARHYGARRASLEGPYVERVARHVQKGSSVRRDRASEEGRPRRRDEQARGTPQCRHDLDAARRLVQDTLPVWCPERESLTARLRHHCDRGASVHLSHQEPRLP